MNGLVELYIGQGRGKTTASFGILMRAFGRGLRCAVVQFLKSQKSGEVITAKNFGIGQIFLFGTENFFDPANPDQKIIAKVEDGIKLASKLLSSGDFELVILDEILTAFKVGIVSEKTLHAIVDKKAKRTELIMTGLEAPQSLIERADLVTEMRKIKHYYDKGVQARRGFEF